MDDDPQPPNSSPPQAQPIYETPDEERPASAAPTEQQLEHETPTVRQLDQSPAPEPHDPYAALRLPAYRYYVSSYSLAVIGGQVQSVALAWQIYQKTHSVLSLGWIGGVQVIPLFLLALPAGHLSDVVSRKKLLIATQWLLVLWGLVLAYLSQFHAEAAWLVPAMYAVILLNAVTLTFARPARSAILPQLVPGEMFNNAVTWNASVFETSSMIGPAVGGMIVGKGGAATAYLMNAALLVACAVLTTQFPDVAIKRWKPRDGDGAAAAAGGVLDYEPGHKPADRGGFSALWAGVAFVFSNKLLLATMTLDLFAVLLGGAVYLLPVFASDILRVGAIGYGWLRMAPSVGAVAMALILAHRPPMKNAGRALLLAVAGFGAATLVFGVSRNFWLSMAMLVLTGAFDNISVVVRHTLVQLLTPDAMRGRVSAVNQVFIGSSNELGGMESGLTAAWLGPVGSVIFGGIGTIVTVLAVAFFSPRLRQLGRLDSISADTESAAAVTAEPTTPAPATV